MIRWLILFLGICSLAYIGAWIAEHSGDISIVWLGWQIDTSVAFLLAALIVMMVLLFGLTELLLSLAGLPGLWRRKREHQHYRQGLSAITQTITSLSIADAKQASKHVASIRRHLGDNAPITLLLEGQLARLENNETAMRHTLERMLKHEETSLVAHTKLVEYHLQHNEEHSALPHAEQAYHHYPRSEPNIRNLVSLYLRTGHADKCLELLAHRPVRKTIASATLQHWKAFAYYQKALTSNASSHNSMIHAKEAFQLAPDCAAITVLYMQAQQAQGELKGAKDSARKCWKIAPHPMVGEAFTTLITDTKEDGLKSVRWLIKVNPDDVESPLLLARTAIDKRDFTLARQTLQPLIQTEADARAYTLMAELEKAEGSNSDVVNGWMLRASQAKPAPVWLCTTCAHNQAFWAMACEHCHTLDSLHWKRVEYPVVMATA